jgi:diguanylate cyclase (GGDEF)-like protein
MAFWGGRRKSDSRFAILLAIASVLCCVWALNLWQRLELGSFVELLELKAYDMRMSLQVNNQEHHPSKEIAIVAFDDATLYAYENKLGTWPWPRTVHVEMIDFMTRAGVKAIAYDILFYANRLGDVKADQALIGAFKRHPNVFFGMNFDNYQLEKLDTAVVENDNNPALLEGVSVPFTNALPPNNPYIAKVDKDGFYQNPNITFSNFRPLMKELYQNGRQLYLINHARDEDGVSRSNALFFRFQSSQPLISKNKPFRKTSTGFKDSKGQAVDGKGRLLGANGQVLKSTKNRYFPQMSLRVLESIKNKPVAKQPFTPWAYKLDSTGNLLFPGYSVPLSNTGVFYVNWYTENVMRERLQELLEKSVLPRYQQLGERQKIAPSPKSESELLLLGKQLEVMKSILEKPSSPQPYETIPGWKVLQASIHQKEKRLNADDKALITFLKDKVIFVGSTAVSSFDIKTTPVSRAIAGVVQQAVIFDNLYHNKGYIVRVPSWFNYVISLVLCLVAGYLVYTIRSAWLGFLIALAVMGTSVAVNIYLFKQAFLWLDLAFPFMAQVFTTTVIYVVKYISRDQDYERTFLLANTDGLTGLHNHRYFQEFMLNSIRKAESDKTKFSLVLVDIDFFKKFNDTYGHQAGDEVLRCVSKKLVSCVRSSDLVARYGGEEMAVVLNNTNETIALQVAQKLVEQIAEAPYPIAAGISKHVTISVGVATYPTHGKIGSELIEFSDHGLYRAKRSGRNKVGAQSDAELEAELEMKGVAAEAESATESVRQEGELKAEETQTEAQAVNVAVPAVVALRTTPQAAAVSVASTTLISEPVLPTPKEKLDLLLPELELPTSPASVYPKPITRLWNNTPSSSFNNTVIDLAPRFPQTPTPSPLTRTEQEEPPSSKP